jgi:hypothetical protein
MSWDVDGVRITRVVEHVMAFPVDFFAEATREDVAAEAWLRPEFVDDDGQDLMSFTPLSSKPEGQYRRRHMHRQLEGPSLIPESDQQHRPFLTHLAASGFPPDTIDLVVCTHLHFDHVGWNTRLVDGEWVPTFPHVRYLFGAADIECWSHSSDPLHAPSFADSVQPVIDAGLVDPVETDVALTGEVLLRRTPGHTRAYERVDRRALCDHW